MKKLVFLLLILGTGISAIAQDIEDFVSKYSDENGYGYLKPLSEVFGANMNSGWYSDAYINHKKFQLYFGLVTTTGLIKDRQKTFDANSAYSDVPVKAPTIFGSNTPTRVQGPDGLAENYPGGMNMNILPLAVPQLSIGGLYGTEASFRFYAANVGDDIGKINLFGWGIRHSISQYFTELPVDLAVGFYGQSFDLEEYIDANANVLVGQVGYRLGILDFYGGLGYEMNSMKIQYDIEENNETTTIKHEYDNQNAIKGTIGAKLNLGAFKLNADYNIGKSNVFSLGIGVGFGNKR